MISVGAKILAKPEAYISVIITYNEMLTFGGTFDPAINLRIVSSMNVTTAHILWVYRIASTTLIRKQTKDIAKRSSIFLNNNWVCQQIVDILSLGKCLKILYKLSRIRPSK